MSALDERGAALVLALMAMLLLSALGLALVATATTELMIARQLPERPGGILRRRRRGRARACRTAGGRRLERAARRVDGSTFVDGAPERRAHARGRLDDRSRRRSTTPRTAGSGDCSAADLVANLTGDRPWGAEQSCLATAMRTARCPFCCRTPASTRPSTSWCSSATIHRKPTVIHRGDGVDPALRSRHGRAGAARGGIWSPRDARGGGTDGGPERSGPGRGASPLLAAGSAKATDVGAAS